MNKIYPNLKIVGNFSPPLGDISNSLNQKIVSDINTLKPNILWVGLGSPRQEKWIYQNFNNLSLNLAIGVGAVFDYVSGKKKKPPKWIKKVGLAWSYRILFQDFSLLWRKRYYAYLWEFIIPVLFQVMRSRVCLLRRGN